MSSDVPATAEETTDCRVIPAGCFPRHETFTADLKAAKISKVDDQGRTVDLHALRGTLLTWLKDAGVHPAVAQRAARHAKVDTTIRHYTHVVDAGGEGGARPKVPLVPEAMRGKDAKGLVRKLSGSSAITRTTAHNRPRVTTWRRNRATRRNARRCIELARRCATEKWRE